MSSRQSYLSPRAGRKPRSPGFRPQLELLESRNLLSFTNVVVNNVAEDTTAQDTQSETSLLVTGSSVFVAFNDSEEYTGSNNHFTGIAHSNNGGTSFTDFGGFPNSTNGDAGDPVLARDNTTGAVYVSTLPFTGINRIQFFSSTSQFTNPVNSAPGFSSRDQLDKDWLTVDNATGSGQGNIYQTFTDFGTTTKISFTRSTNHGASFTPSGGTTLATGVVQGSYVVVGPDHSVYVFWLDQNSGTKLMEAKSTNQGSTFGTPVTVATLKTNGVNGDLGLNGGFRGNAFPHVAVNPISGNLYVVYNDVGVAAGDKADVFFTQSTNGGTSWTSPVKVNDDTTTNDQWQPDVAVSPDGTRIGIFWYDRRLDPANSLIDWFGVTGAISGSTVTFGANFRVSNTSFPVVIGQDPVINSTYMGDYDQAAADNTNFYTTWGDNQNSDAAHAHEPDVFFAVIPRTTGFTSALAQPPAGGTGSSPTDGIDPSWFNPPAHSNTGRDLSFLNLLTPAPAGAASFLRGTLGSSNALDNGTLLAVPLTGSASAVPSVGVAVTGAQESGTVVASPVSPALLPPALQATDGVSTGILAALMGNAQQVAGQADGWSLLAGTTSVSASPDDPLVLFGKLSS